MTNTLDNGSVSKKQRTHKVALVTGVTGQDGAYLSEFLLNKGYEVHGIKRRSSSHNQSRIDHLFFDKDIMNSNRFQLHYGDLLDPSSLVTIIMKCRPDEVYNLGAQSHVKVSFELPVYTNQVDGLGTLNLLEAIRSCGMTKDVRFYQASTSELYGKIQAPRQNEDTPFYPRSPYGVAKLMAFWTVKNYREAYDMFAVNGILFNHESEKRGETFVTRKITRAVANIHRGRQDQLVLGNIDARRDWGHAADYVEGMWLMLQTSTPEDFVLATGVDRSVRCFCEKAFDVLGMTLKWEGSGVDEIGTVEIDGARKVVVAISERFYRPTEVDVLLGDPSKAKRELGWEPKITFSEMVGRMVRSDLALVDREIIMSEHDMKSDAGKTLSE